MSRIVGVLRRVAGRRTVTAAAVIAAAGAVITVARRRLLVVEVVGDSMSPAYHNGDHLLVRRTRRFRTGQVVIAHHQEGGRRYRPSDSFVTTWLVKRLVALSGDQVPASMAPVADVSRPVPAGMAVLIGDHPGSADSRSWGFIPLADLAGVVVTRLRPGPGKPAGSTAVTG